MKDPLDLRPGEARKLAFERAGGACDRCRTATPWEWGEAAHRLPRSGGGRWVGSNIAWLCRACHGWAHAHSTAAYDEGWSVRRGADPAEIPCVRLDGERIRLTDEWCYGYAA